MLIMIRGYCCLARSLSLFFLFALMLCGPALHLSAENNELPGIVSSEVLEAHGDVVDDVRQRQREGDWDLHENAENPVPIFSVKTEFLYWKPFSNDIDIAVDQSGAQAVPSSHSTLEWGNGYRATVSAGLDSEAVVSFRITSFESDSRTGFTRPSIDLTRLDPAGLTNLGAGSFAGSATSSYAIDYLALDLEFSQWVSLDIGGEGTRVRPYITGRVMYLGQQINTTYTSGPDIVGLIEKNDTLSASFLLGSELDFVIFKGFSVVGQLGGGIAYFATGRQHTEFDLDGGATLATDLDDYRDTVGLVYEARFGIQYRQQFEHLEASLFAGYEFHGYAGLSNFIKYTDDFEDDHTQFGRSDLGFHGVTLAGTILVK